MESTPTPSPPPSTQPVSLKTVRHHKPTNPSTKVMAPTLSSENIHTLLHTISTSARGTPFEKRVWSLLLQIPPGQVSTYALMASHLHSSPRAVGNALRRNPFAPEVPCHRVVNTGGTIGGFKGKKGREGEGTTLPLKRQLLRREGIKFDGKGGVLGTPFQAFV